MMCVCLSVCLISALWSSQTWRHSDFLPGSHFWSICLHQSPCKSFEKAEMIAGERMLFSDYLVASWSEAVSHTFPWSSAKTWKDLITLFLPKQEHAGMHRAVTSHLQTSSCRSKLLYSSSSESPKHPLSLQASLTLPQGKRAAKGQPMFS